MTEETRKQPEECTCGIYYGIDYLYNEDSPDQDDQGAEKTSHNLDVSFVHLPLSFNVKDEENIPSQLRRLEDGDSDLLKWFERTNLLEKAANDQEHPPSLCLECIRRVERALDNDTARLYSECQTYRDAIQQEQEKRSRLEQALKVASFSEQPENTERKQVVEEAYTHEIENLKEACDQQEEELRRLLSVRREQLAVSKELDRFDYDVHEESNALELEARHFENDQEEMYGLLLTMQNEVERLSQSNRIRLPKILCNLQVDRERGLRYPLINELRLAYRPKGDVQWAEIQAAWSLVAQLLLHCATLFDFDSQNWKIVPLSNCAKLMYYREITNESGNKQRVGPVVYNLGHPKTNGCKAFIALGALLHQVISHAQLKMKESNDHDLLDVKHILLPPFETSVTSIGELELSQIAEEDDMSWSRVVHYFASNLDWLSTSASNYTSHQVVLAASMD